MDAVITSTLLVLLLPCAVLLAFLGLLTVADGTPGPPTRYSRLKFACAFGTPVAAICIYATSLIGAIRSSGYSWAYPVGGFVALVGTYLILIPAAQKFSAKHHRTKSTLLWLFK